MVAGAKRVQSKDHKCDPFRETMVLLIEQALETTHPLHCNPAIIGRVSQVYCRTPSKQTAINALANLANWQRLWLTLTKYRDHWKFIGHISSTVYASYKWYCLVRSQHQSIALSGLSAKPRSNNDFQML